MKKDRQLVILLAALLVLIFLSSCAAGKNASMTPAATDFAYAEDYSYTRDAPAEEPQAEAPMANEDKAEIGGAMGEMSFDDTAEAEEAPAGSPESQGSAADITEKIIYSACVSIETTDFDASVSGLEQKIRSLGGFVENSNVSGDTRWNNDGTTSVVNRWAYYTFRIPAEKFEYFLQLTHTYGNVLLTSRSAQNVTSSYTDFEARLSSLNTQEERLLDMLSKSTDVETVVLLSHKKPDGHINVKVEFGEGEGKVPLDNIAKRAEEYKPKERVTYKMIKEYIEAKYGFKVHTAYIAEVKRDLGLPMYDAPNAVEELKQPRKHPTAEKVEAIKDALKHFEVI